MGRYYLPGLHVREGQTLPAFCMNIQTPAAEIQKPLDFHHARPGHRAELWLELNWTVWGICSILRHDQLA